jgi:hypothetical protein
MTTSTTHRCAPVPGDHAPLIVRILPAPPKCSRCRSRRVYAGTRLFTGEIRYERQCSRCITWSRAARRDVLRCLDCRRWINPVIETWSEQDREFQRRYGRQLRRCTRCQRAKLAREHTRRVDEGSWNPASPFYGVRQHQEWYQEHAAEYAAAAPESIARNEAMQRDDPTRYRLMLEHMFGRSEDIAWATRAWQTAHPGEDLPKWNHRMERFE